MDLILDRLSELETLWRQLIKTDKEPDLQEQDSQLAQQRAREIEQITGVIDEFISDSNLEKGSLNAKIAQAIRDIEERTVTTGVCLFPLEPYRPHFSLYHQFQKFDIILAELGEIEAWMNGRRSELLTECLQIFEEEQHELQSAESNEPIPSWVIDLLRLEASSENNRAALLMDLSITSDSEAITNLEAESQALHYGAGNSMADRLARMVEAHEVLRHRLDVFNAESSALWQELRHMQVRLSPFSPEQITEESAEIEKALQQYDAAGAVPRIARSVLRRVHGAWRCIERDRSESLSGSILLIGRLWDLLEKPASERFHLDSQDISLRNMELLLAERRKLIDFQQQRFRELYETHLQELRRLMQALRMNARQQAELLASVEEYTAEGLQQLARHLAVLQPKLEQTREVIQSIDARTSLIQRMREFEISASDPARLFRSSFQLLQEEKFRKTALPNLLTLESRLKGQLAEYERRFGEAFICDETGEEVRAFAEVLEEEIQGRYLNDGIFGFDQAKQRKERTERQGALVGSAPRYLASSTKPVARKIASIGTGAVRPTGTGTGTPVVPQRRPASRLDK